uniref:Uncharacterized protein n=1 Tax=Candidatus Kentrum eta TaxID=2126337 RepID=A0A450UZ96_9GAMM|nr:MAG: hypothetical protein BECKH772A_GA0070896_101155 [Candidatus Kentron sp. H]VFJ97890.1 MAG: hypothetical protein BECKH772B_GA0070898_101215 [Candidatus Kentron sp. H]VFK03153.1 MAG: hypothetical protein BECKH772C_GA0070978_101155 [Candidatus Kentron sp. H]
MIFLREMIWPRFAGRNKLTGSVRNLSRWYTGLIYEDIGNMLNQLGKILNQSTPGKPRAKKPPCRMTLTLENIREQLLVQADRGGGYNRNAAREMLAQVECGYGQQAVDDLIREFDLESTFDFKPGNSFLSEK